MMQRENTKRTGKRKKIVVVICLALIFAAIVSISLLVIHIRRLRTELDTLAALVESHFTYEERKLVDALNSLTGGDLAPFADPALADHVRQNNPAR